MKSLLGTNVRKRRKAVGISQADLAEQANISINFLSKLERNKSTKVSSDTLNALASALHISMEALVNGDDSSETTEMGPKQAQLNQLLEGYPLLEREQLCANIIEILKKRR